MGELGISAFLRSVLDKFIAHRLCLTSLESITAVMGEGEYRPSAVAAFLAHDQVEVAAAARDLLDQLWVAVWYRESLPHALLLRRVDASSIVAVRGLTG